MIQRTLQAIGKVMTLTKMGPRRHARLEDVSAEPREEGIAPSGITVGTAVAEPVTVEVEASPAVGKRSGEESAQAEINPQAAKEGQFRNSCGICPTCCWRTSITRTPR